MGARSQEIPWPAKRRWPCSTLIEKENLCARANVLGERFRKRAAKWQAQWELVGEVRGLGAMQALELVRSEDNAPAR